MDETRNDPCKIRVQEVEDCLTEAKSGVPKCSDLMMKLKRCYGINSVWKFIDLSAWKVGENKDGCVSPIVHVSHMGTMILLFQDEEMKNKYLGDDRETEGKRK